MTRSLANLWPMPRRSEAYGTPRQWLVRGSWPNGTFREDTPEVVAYAVQLAITLEAALEGLNKSAVASSASLTRTTLYDMLAGNAWADMVSIARLEEALQTDLWPTRPPRLNREAGSK